MDRVTVARLQLKSIHAMTRAERCALIEVYETALQTRSLNQLEAYRLEQAYRLNSGK
jgi:hypothetical protein